MGVIVYHCKPGKSDSLRGEEILKLHTLLLKSYPQTTTVCFAAESGFYFLWKKKKKLFLGGADSNIIKNNYKDSSSFHVMQVENKISKYLALIYNQNFTNQSS